MTFCYAQRGTLSVAAPFMIRELGINTETMGLMLSAFSWCYSFMQVPSGWVVDRFGVRRAYAAGFALWSVSCALTGAFRHIAAIMFFRVIMGIGQSVAFPASARTVADWFPKKERALAFGWVNCGTNIGAILAPLLAVQAAHAFGWRVCFLFLGGIGIVWIFFWLRFYHPPAEHPRISQAELDYIQSDPPESLENPPLDQPELPPDQPEPPPPLVIPQIQSDES